MDTTTAEAGSAAGGVSVEDQNTDWFDGRGSHSRTVPRSLRGTASRQRVMALTVIDQGASSANNFGLSFIIAHYSHASVLGIFAIVNTTWILIQLLVRSLTSDCLLTRSDTDDGVMLRYERSGYLSAIMCSAGLAVLVLALSTAFSGQLRITFVIFGLSLPFLSAQDYARFLGISRFNPAYAIWLDCSWLVLSFVGYFALRHTGHTSLPWMFGAWSVAGALVGIYTMRNHLPVRNLWTKVKFWFRSEHAVGLRFAGQSLLVSSWAYAAIYLFILIFSLAVIGEFKLAQVAFGPITVLAQGICSGLIAVAARYFHSDVRKALRFVLLAAVTMAVFVLAWTAALYAFPLSTMTKALGTTWPAAHRLVPLMGLAFALTYVSGVTASGLRAIRAAKENLRLAVAMVPLLAVCCLGGAVLWGVQAAIAGLCVGYGVYSVAGWVILVRCAHRLTPDSLAAEEVDETIVPIEANDAGSTLPTVMAFETADPVGVLGIRRHHEEEHAGSVGVLEPGAAAGPHDPAPDDAAMSGAEPPATGGTGAGGGFAGDPDRSNLSDYGRVLRGRKWVVIITALVAVVGVLGYCEAVGKTYKATAVVFLEPAVSATLTQAPTSSTASAVNVADVIQVMESAQIQNIVARTVANPPSVTVTQVGTALRSDIVDVTASSGDPHVAAAAANAYAAAYISYEQGVTRSTFTSAQAQIQNKIDTVQLAISTVTNEIRTTPGALNISSYEVQLGDLQSQLSGLENQLQVYEFYATAGNAAEAGRVITTATVPTRPSSPKTLEYTVIALVVGLILGLGLALLVNTISSRRI